MRVDDMLGFIWTLEEAVAKAPLR